MPWRTAVLRGTRVLARCDEGGELCVDGGRVEIRYRPKDGKAYQAAARNLELEPEGEIFPDAHCAAGEPVASAPKEARGGKHAGVGKRAQGGASGAMPAPTDAKLIAYTDGACSGNPGPAGLGAVLMTEQGVRELSEYLGIATNNIAELTAIFRVLEALDPTDEPLVVHTDSQYAIGVLQKGWKAKANQELIHALKQRIREFGGLSLVYVRGHAGVPLNERADQLARAAVEARASSGWLEVKVHGRPNG